VVDATTVEDGDRTTDEHPDASNAWSHIGRSVAQDVPDASCDASIPAVASPAVWAVSESGPALSDVRPQVGSPWTHVDRARLIYRVDPDVIRSVFGLSGTFSASPPSAARIRPPAWSRVLRLKRRELADGDQFEARKRLELNAESLSTRVAPSFSEFCKHQYKPYAETNLKASTWRKVRIYQLATLEAVFGTQKLTGISNEQIESYKRLRARAVRPSSVNNELRVLRTVLNYAAETGYPAARPKFKKLRQRGQARPQAWTAADLNRLFAEAREESPELLRLLVFLANTGCRKGEALACEWGWIDFDAEMIRIPSNEYWQPKNGKPREVPMSDACRAVLSGPKASERWVFPKASGERYVDFPKDAFWAARNRAKLTGGPRTLRQTFASHFLQAVPDMSLLARVLGHSSQRVTELYAHLLPDHLARARNAVNLGPTLQTVATTVATEAKIANSPKKSHKRH
jgi:integrase